MSSTTSAPDPFGQASQLGDPYAGLLPYARDRRTGKLVWAGANDYRGNSVVNDVDTMIPPAAPVGPVGSTAVGRALQPAPGTTYGDVLPYARDNASGALRWAMPNMARSMLQGGVDLADGPATGEVSRDAAGALSMLTGRNLLAGVGDSEASFGALGARSRKAKAPSNALEDGLPDTVPAAARPPIPADPTNPLAGVDMSPRALASARRYASTGAAGEDERISTRVPWSVPMGGQDGSIAHQSADYIVGRDSSRMSHAAYAKNATLLQEYHGVRMPEPGASAEDVSHAFVSHLKDNILGLHDAVDPEIAKRSKLWYDGAFRIAHDWAAEYGMNPRAIAGALAALSPQMDWFKNVGLARRVLDIDQRQGNSSMTSGMKDYAEKYIESVRNDRGTKSKPKNPENQIAAADDLQEQIRQLQGRPLSQIRDQGQRAIWTRLYDEAHNPRQYRIVTPEGNMAGYSLTGKGVPEKIGWSGFDEIGKAISSIKDDSLENISRSMGGNHKVRNFYNNIISPNSRFGDVTIDTHAIAAGLLRPLSGKHIEVKQGLGTGGASDASGTGSRGLYGLYADAYRQAAAERGILPREMQSITWEAGRGLFSAGDKRNVGFAARVKQVWDDYQKGTIHGDEARSRITAIAGGIDKPDWHPSRIAADAR
jgi:hypothetical protein